eukprot:CFRG1028T1
MVSKMCRSSKCRLMSLRIGGGAGFNKHPSSYVCMSLYKTNAHQKRSKMSVPFHESKIAMMDDELAHKVRSSAAECETEFKGAGEVAGIEVWRIEDFKVKRIDQSSIGQFYEGDSYIVLNSYHKHEDNKLFYNVHFWLGEQTTQDEAGTAAYKAVELDTLLGDMPIQYREVMGCESDEFIKLFPPAPVIMPGGCNSGFEKVEPIDYRPRLLHVKGQRKLVKCFPVPCKRESLNKGDCFILDLGLKIFLWMGSGCGVFEKTKAAEICQFLRDQRHGKTEYQVLDGTERCDSFWDALGGQGEIKSAEEGGSDSCVDGNISMLFRISDAAGETQLTKVKEGDLSKGDLDTSDAYLIDMLGLAIFIWVGAQASHDERNNAFQIANKYIRLSNLPLTVPVSLVMEGSTSAAFDAVCP